MIKKKTILAVVPIDLIDEQLDVYPNKDLKFDVLDLKRSIELNGILTEIIVVYFNGRLVVRKGYDLLKAAKKTNIRCINVAFEYTNEQDYYFFISQNYLIRNVKEELEKINPYELFWEIYRFKYNLNFVVLSRVKNTIINYLSSQIDIDTEKKMDTLGSISFEENVVAFFKMIRPNIEDRDWVLNYTDFLIRLNDIAKLYSVNGEYYSSIENRIKGSL